MDNDLDDALKILGSALELPDDAAAELLSILEMAERSPKQSVLHPEGKPETVELGEPTNGGYLWLTTARVYDHTFAFLIRCTRRGNRGIAKVWRITPSSTH